MIAPPIRVSADSEPAHLAFGGQSRNGKRALVTGRAPAHESAGLPRWESGDVRKQTGLSCQMYANRRCANRQACRRDAIGQRSRHVFPQRSRCWWPVARGNAARVPERQPPHRHRHPRPRGRRNRARTLATTAHTLRDRRGHARRGGRSARLAPVFHPDDLCYRIPQSDRAPKSRLPRIAPRST